MVGLATVCLLCLAGSEAIAAEPASLQFVVRAQAQDAEPRCAPAATRRCRDDLTLTEVFAALRTMARGDTPASFGVVGPVSSVEVRLGPGLFRVREALRLSGWSPRGRFGPLLVAGSGSGKSIVSGAIAVPATAWRPVAEGEIRVAAALRSQVRIADLGKLLPLSVEMLEPATGFGEPVLPMRLNVLASGQRLTLARWPNQGWTRVGRAAAVGSGSLAQAARLIPLPDGHFDAWRNEAGLRAVGYFSHDWAFERLPIEAVNRVDGSLLLKGLGAKFGVRSGQRIFIENALAELDQAGEWYFDTAQQALYLWPPEGAAASEIEVVVAVNLLTFTDSAGITVQDLGLQSSTGDAVRILGSRNVTVADTVIRNAGNRAVLIEGGFDVTLRGVVMSDLGEGGVAVSGGERSTLLPSRHIVEGCRIQRFALHSRSYRPAISIEGVGVQVLRNRIVDGPHVAITFGGNDHVIDGNHISDVATETNDVGAIYTGRDWTARGTLITNNLLQNIYARLPGASSVMGIYLDDQASGVTVSGNVFANVSRPVLIGGGRENTIDRNIFVLSSPAVLADNRGATWQREQTLDVNGYLQRNLRQVPVSGSVYRSRYPRLSEILEDEPGRTKYNRASGNLFIESKGFEFLDGAQAGMSVSDNHTQAWSVFKTLRGPKAAYSPQDFELTDTTLTSVLRAAYPPRGAIPP